MAVMAPSMVLSVAREIRHAPEHGPSHAHHRALERIAWRGPSPERPLPVALDEMDNAWGNEISSLIFVAGPPGTTRSHQELPGGQDPQGATRTRSHQEPHGPPGATRGHQEPPGATRSHQEPPGATRGRQEPPGTTRSHQEPRFHGFSALCLPWAACALIA